MRIWSGTVLVTSVRLQRYIVEADTPREAAELIRNGETLEEHDLSSGEIVNRVLEGRLSDITE